ncbi:hypothetical protein THIOM_003489 [Candidatus Thiomargarita nelsonii]|uniref:Uncharacterized protein n=1 Tax=Candidatus Thiomargarita nelsonii TaxID=1003181 RepID=A0A176RYI7_9GAMM|nr:hypothetical protein THIOM_003489 [Candidatus Thiomargarita nelsonii]
MTCIAKFNITQIVNAPLAELTPTSDMTNDETVEKTLVTIYSQPYPDWFEESTPYDPYGDITPTPLDNTPIETEQVDRS